VNAGPLAKRSAFSNAVYVIGAHVWEIQYGEAIEIFASFEGV
jgi:hypothetical protein